MFKQCKLAVIVLVASLGLIACSKKPEPVAFNTLEDARNTARNNALFNAQAYRAENPRFDNFNIVSHGDSTQSPECPQGDGWATVSIMKVDNKVVEKYTVKCSTVSGALGCYMEADFKKKPFASEENMCQSTNKVPFPIPKIAK